MAANSSYDGGGPSKMAHDAMCMCETPSSTWRNTLSSGPMRSMRRPPESGTTAQHTLEDGLTNSTSLCSAADRDRQGRRSSMRHGDSFGWTVNSLRAAASTPGSEVTFRRDYGHCAPDHRRRSVSVGHRMPLERRGD